MTYPQLDIANVPGSTATIHTNLGDMNVRLFDNWTPKTVKNFVTLSQQGYYEGVIFHRVIPDFMIQGGDPTGTGMGGESIYGAKFEDEFSEDLFNLRGALSMANAGPGTNGSQFFLVQNQHMNYPVDALIEGGWPGEIAEKYATEGGTPHLDGHHTVFGQLLDADSFATLDHIASVTTDAADRPVKPVTILSIEILPMAKEAGPEPEKTPVKSDKTDHSQVYVNYDHQMAIGDVFNAEIIGLQKYGAFVKFDGDKKGLVHISELRSGFVKDIHEEVKIGNKLKVQVIDIDEYSGRVSLSARTLEEHPQTHRATRKHFFTDHRIEIGFAPLDELMPRWTKEQEAYLKNHHA